jgi:hypothetical protein
VHLAPPGIHHSSNLISGEADINTFERMPFHFSVMLSNAKHMHNFDLRQLIESGGIEIARRLAYNPIEKDFQLQT